MTGTFHKYLYAFFIISRTFLLIIRNVSDKPYRENQKHISHFQIFFRKSCKNVEKYGRTGQATDDNMAYAYCMLDN